MCICMHFFKINSFLYYLFLYKLLYMLNIARNNSLHLDIFLQLMSRKLVFCGRAALCYLAFQIYILENHKVYRQIFLLESFVKI